MRLSGKQRKEKILLAAKKLFSQKGFKGTTIQSLAKEAELSEAGIYKYFKSKREIYEALFDQKIKEIDFYFPSSFSSEKTLKIKLKELIQKFIERNSKDPSFLRIILYSNLEGNKFSINLFNKMRKEFFYNLSNIFKQEIEKGNIKDIDPNIISKFFFALIYYTLLLKTLFKDEEFVNMDLNELAEIILEIFFKGVEKNG